MRAALFFLALGCGLALPAFGQSSLTVGTKVIYPGGADQPPKEKDTGVSLKVDKIIGHGSADSERDGLPLAPGQAALETLLAEGRPEEILQIVGNRSDPLSRAYRALALLDLGKTSLARQEADQALAQRRFPPDLRARLEAAFPATEPVDPEEAASCTNPDLADDLPGSPPDQ